MPKLTYLKICPCTRHNAPEALTFLSVIGIQLHTVELQPRPGKHPRHNVWNILRDCPNLRESSYDIRNTEIVPTEPPTHASLSCIHYDLDHWSLLSRMSETPLCGRSLLCLPIQQHFLLWRALFCWVIGPHQFSTMVSVPCGHALGNWRKISVPEVAAWRWFAELVVLISVASYSRDAVLSRDSKSVLLYLIRCALPLHIGCSTATNPSFTRTPPMHNTRAKPRPPPGWIPFAGAPPVPPGVNPYIWSAGAWQLNPAYRNHRITSYGGNYNNPTWVAGYGWYDAAQPPPAGYNLYKRVPRQASAEYWAVALSDNPLGLTNMIPR
jgi:hypothetical protein